jgi:putative ABC transport system permease protein
MAVLKSRLYQIRGKVKFRKVLVALQYVILSALIIISLVISRQHKFVTADHAGLTLDRIMVIPLKDHCDKNEMEAFKNELQMISGIDLISASSSLPMNTSGMLHVECEGYDESFNMVFMDLDANLPKLYGMELVDGRFFDPNSVSDEKHAYIINETAAQMLGWHKAEGQDINYSNKGLRNVEFEKGNLIGIVKDFNHSPKHSSIKPMIIKIRHNPRYVSILYSGDQYERLVKEIGKAYEHVFNAPLFDLIQALKLHDDLYSGENRMKKIFTFSAIFSLFLACISIISLVKLEMKVKYKEIGIRKIFGAGRFELLKRYLLHYVIIVIISYVLSIPIAMVFAKEWLSGFAYSINISPELFLLAFILIISASMLVIIWQVLTGIKMKALYILKYD